MRRVLSSLASISLACVVLESPLWADKRGGWDDDINFVYCYDADPGEDLYAGTFDALGNLDGSWRRSTQSDQWDGSSPADGDGAPGGAAIRTAAGEGEDGGDASVLSIEDPGDPTSSGYPDPSNRKLFFWRDTTADLDIEEGVTLLARWRLAPEPETPGLAGPNGSNLHDGGKGQIGFAQRVAAGGAPIADIGLAIDDRGKLQVAIPGSGADIRRPEDGGTNGGYCVDVDEGGWVTVWLAARASGGAVEIRAYLNGDLSPAVSATLSGAAIPTGVEGGTRPEVGTAATSYVYTALGSTAQDGAIQVDYVCVARGFLYPGGVNAACPISAVAAADGRDVVLSWTPGTKNPTGVDVLRDGTTIATNAPADPPRFQDSDVPPGAHSYELRFEVTGETCEPLTATINTCLAGALGTAAVPAGVLLRWSVPSGVEHAGYRILRDGVEIAAAPGTATSYLDETAGTGTFVYGVVPDEGTCAPLEATVSYVRAVVGTGDFSSEAVGWSYELDPPPDADPAEYLLHEPVANADGDLDGNWSSGNGSDSWDGSAPGEIGDPALDVVGQVVAGAEAPGGIGLITTGGVGAYLFEDVGDPRTAIPPNTVGWKDPSNRKLYLLYDMRNAIDDAGARSLIADGVTLRARFRLTPPEEAVDVKDAPNGYPTATDGKGNFVIAHDATVTGQGVNQRISVSLDVNPEAPGTGILFVGDAGALAAGGTATEYAVPIADPTNWLDLWLAVEDPDPATPEVSLKLYLNGSAEPTLAVDDFLPNDKGSENGLHGNELAMGLHLTPDSGSLEVDLVSVLDGAVEPSGPPADLPFHRGDADGDGALNLTDGVFVLNYLFLGGPAPPCMDAADANDDGQINIADGIYVLNFLFIGGPEPPRPGPVAKPCGTDPTADPLGCARYTKC